MSVRLFCVLIIAELIFYYGELRQVRWVELLGKNFEEIMEKVHAGNSFLLIRYKYWNSCIDSNNIFFKLYVKI